MENIKKLEEAQIRELGTNIQLLPVISSNILAIGYNEEYELLKVCFKGKETPNIYIYENVKKELYETIRNSQSIGKTLSENIIRQKEQHNYIKL